MKEDKEHQKDKAAIKNRVLQEDEGKRTPPTHPKEVTGGGHAAARPEQEPEAPPEDRTAGIP